MFRGAAGHSEDLNLTFPHPLYETICQTSHCFNHIAAVPFDCFWKLLNCFHSMHTLQDMESIPIASWTSMHAFEVFFFNL